MPQCPKWLLLVFFFSMARIGAQPFVNFETAPVHPVAISPDGKTLAVCNLPAARVEIIDLTVFPPRKVRSIFTGLDPVSARFSPNGELWVANHISDSISIIDSTHERVIFTLDTFDGPADIVFAAGQKALVSQSGANTVQVWDWVTRRTIGSIDIEGDRPKAMAVSSDGSEVYVAILESGNSSTIIAPSFGRLFDTPTPSVVDLPEAPNGGLNPAPNFGDLFNPSINPSIPATNPPPRVGLIIRKQNGRWLDDRHSDWSEYISGTNAFLTGRTQGWDIADHDIAVITVTNGAVRYIRGLMNICFDLAVNPANGRIALIGTDAINEVRFEPVLQSIFARMKMALVDPIAPPPTILDLNPHLDYSKRSQPLVERRESVGDPRGIAWNAKGTRAYVTGMGSNNILMLDEEGRRVGPGLELPEGPTGVAVDDARNRVYVLSRFASKLVVLNAATLAIEATMSLFDPTPEKVRAGRKHFYGTHKTSGLGHVSCATCHVDGRFDRLAWDIGTPAGEMLMATNRNFQFAPTVTNHFHPMKGPMVTQTLQDIIGHEPFHWRGDRSGLEEFNPTFKDLQGADAELTDAEMQEFEDFLSSIVFPPNRNRNLDNTLPTSLPLPSERTFGRGSIPAGQLFPAGNAQRGLALFSQRSCQTCHILPTGLGPDAAIPAGPNGERHLAMVADPRTSGLPFKIPHLRHLFEKNGFSLRGPISRSGFGFMHDGRVDSLARFLQDGFALRDDQETADMIAFLMAFSGSGLPPGRIFDPSAPDVVSGDVPAGVGLHGIQTDNVANSRIVAMMNHARLATSRVDLIVHGVGSWLMDGTNFLADRPATNSLSEVLSFASPQTPLLFTFVPRGSGARLALDRDQDGVINQIEIDAGADPDDPSITPTTTTPRLLSIAHEVGRTRLQWYGALSNSYRIQIRTDLSTNSSWTDFGEPIVATEHPVKWSSEIAPGRHERFFRVIHAP